MAEQPTFLPGKRLQRRLAGVRGRWRPIRFSGEAGGRQPHGIQPSLQC